MNVTELAAVLDAAAADRTPVAPLSDTEPGLDLDTAYRVQRALRTAQEPAAGWKLGLTSRAKQQQVAVDQPIFGFLPSTGALDIGAPLPTGGLIAPRCEPEIVFVLSRDLSGPHVTADLVLAATESVAVGIEVLDSRYVDFRFTTPDVVADNTSAARFLVGAPVDPAGIDLRLVGVLLEHNGRVVAAAAGAASLGHPAAAVAWLVRRLAGEGTGLRAGQIVLSGGLTAAVPVTAGDVVVASVDRLGSVELACGDGVDRDGG